MIAFDTTRGLDALAFAVLSEPSPVSLLSDWVDAAPQGELAKVLHIIHRKLLQGESHPELSATALEIRLGERYTHLDLLLIPSVFAPEAWGMTFLEGLLRKPLRVYRGKRMVELGVGSGWISLALLRLTQLSQIIGVDLNPEAVKIARLNALVNGYDAEGKPHVDRLFDRFSSAESDLLRAVQEKNRKADFVIGCIPQVIAPEADTRSTQGLYELSNYAVAQGVVEDAFGLGLNARALRDALTVLEPGGSVILNLATRPGERVLERMFERRGYRHEVLWRARVEQAGDTDINPLVELEERSGQLFAFQLHRHSREAISARVAEAARSFGLPIYHELRVIEGRPQSDALLPLASAFAALGLNDLWERVELSRASDEQIRFVTALAEKFVHERRAPYPHEAGDLAFRQRISGFLAKFQALSIAPEEIFVGPTCADLVYSLLLSLVNPGDVVLVSQNLRGALAPAIAKHGAKPVWVHNSASEIAELLPALAPRLLIIAPEAAERFGREALRQLLRKCEAQNTLLCLDDSGAFEITAKHGDNPILAFLAQEKASAHLALLVGLIHSQAFPDIELALFLCRNPELQTALAYAAEVTYSRISCFHQAYYAELFDELLTFRVGPEETPLTTFRRVNGPAVLPRIAQLGQLPVFARAEPDPDVLRLDYGENELPMPKSLAAGILEGLLAAPGAGRELGPTLHEAVLQYLRLTRLPNLAAAELLLGNGVTPLLYDALLAEQKRLGRPLKVVHTRVGWGMVPAILAALGAESLALDAPGPDYLLDAAALPEQFDLLLLANPGNPSGTSYSADALQALIRAANRCGARVLLDEVFGLLADLNNPELPKRDLWQGLSDNERQTLLVVCGLSKEFAAGGLRVAFAASGSREWLERMAALRLSHLPIHAQAGTLTTLQRFVRAPDEILEMRRTLQQRRERLSEALTQWGLVHEKSQRGGLFLFVAPKPGAVSDVETFVLDVEKQARVRLNTPAWAGAQRELRVCYCVAESTLDQALKRLELALPRLLRQDNG